MNLLHMKYALAVAETNSINKAAEKLLVGAPALSRAVKELENGLGVTLFERSAKGMFLTADGALFVRYAKKALKQIDDLETIFKDGGVAKEQFSVSGPRAGYLAKAFAEFSKGVDPKSETELFYYETNAYGVIHNLTKEDYRLGILRYSARHEVYYQAMMEEKGLCGEVIASFRHVLLMSRESPLCRRDAIAYPDLNGYVEIAHADPYVPSFPMSRVKKEERPDREGCRVYVFERASQFELLSKNPNTFMWASPVPQDLLDRYGLTERTCEDNQRVYQDVLVRRADHTLSDLDQRFVEALLQAKREVFRDR